MDISKPFSATVDLEDRDPNTLSQHLQVSLVSSDKYVGLGVLG